MTAMCNQVEIAHVEQLEDLLCNNVETAAGED
jgi:hypothetical protein